MVPQAGLIFQVRTKGWLSSSREALGMVEVWSINSGIAGVWLSLITILLFVFHWKGMIALSWGFQQSHSQRFQPVLRRVQGGFVRRVLSIGGVHLREPSASVGWHAGDLS
jgi:hypothetical protein